MRRTSVGSTFYSAREGEGGREREEGEEREREEKRERRVNGGDNNGVQGQGEQETTGARGSKMEEGGTEIDNALDEEYIVWERKHAEFFRDLFPMYDRDELQLVIRG